MAENKINAEDHPYKLLLIGGSAGSLSMVLKVLAHMPNDIGVAIILVIHRKDSDESTLVDLLANHSTFTVKEAEEKEQILPGFLYVAPNDYHLLIEKDFTISLDCSEKINYSRPSIDVTFESAADAYGPSLVALLLSGANADGTQGLVEVKKMNGLIVVQDPTDSEFPFMPQQALNALPPDMLLSYERVPLLADLVKRGRQIY